MNEFLVVMSACSSFEEAERIAHAAVEARLAACGQILPAMRSIYRWKGQVESATEHLLLLKTSSAKFELLKEKIEEHHSYEVAEIVALPVECGSAAYLAWLTGSLLSEEANG